MPYVAEILDFFRDKKLKLAIVTSSPRKDVEAVLEKNGLGKYFQLIITRSDVIKSKPVPESYTMCREQLGLSVDECLAFEDTSTGVKSAKAAGLTCYAIQSNNEEHARLDLADKLFLNFEDTKNYMVENNII